LELRDSKQKETIQQSKIKKLLKFILTDAKRRPCRD